MNSLLTYNFHHIDPNNPPYSSMEDMWVDIPRQVWRSFRKKVGLAVSPDVQTMSGLVRKLLSLSKSTTLPYVVMSYPEIAAIYTEDINDLAEYLGFPKLTGFYKCHPWEAYAAFAGQGLGMRELPEDKDIGRDERKQLPVSWLNIPTKPSYCTQRLCGQQWMWIWGPLAFMQ
jgi:hypothetical protein